VLAHWTYSAGDISQEGERVQIDGKKKHKEQNMNVVGTRHIQAGVCVRDFGRKCPGRAGWPCQKKNFATGSISHITNKETEKRNGRLEGPRGSTRSSEKR